MRKRVFISGPLTRGDLADNVNAATDAFLELTAAGFAAFCPHWSCWSGRALKHGDKVFAIAAALPNELSWQQWVEVDLPWVTAAHAVLRLPGESAGGDLEVSCARDHGIPVFYSVAEVVSHFKEKSQ